MTLASHRNVRNAGSVSPLLGINSDLALLRGFFLAICRLRGKSGVVLAPGTLAKITIRRK